MRRHNWIYGKVVNYRRQAIKDHQGKDYHMRASDELWNLVAVTVWQSGTNKNTNIWRQVDDELEGLLR